MTSRSASPALPFCLLLTAGAMWPSEGAINGDGLHLVVLWLAYAVFAVIRGRECGEGSPVAGSAGTIPLTERRVYVSLAEVRSSIPVALLLTGFGLSTWYVFREQGDRRAAVNLAFEWTGVCAAWFILKHYAPVTRQWLLPLLIGLATGMSLLGIWQHHVGFEKQRMWYLERRSELDGIQPGSEGRSLLHRATPEAEFHRLEIPLEGGERALFERRLLSSMEPIGPFALANTLGGMLAVAIVLLIAGLMDTIRSKNGLSLKMGAFLLFVGFLLGYCLLLTKSRTSWVGCTTGVCLNLARHASDRRLMNWIRGLGVTFVCIVGLGLTVGVATGGLDREVILESPRSLQFRLLYWTGTIKVIGDSPVFGTGPGNFRQKYLSHKAVDSSEDILDPHNILLDGWCSAGLAGLLAVIGLAVGAWRAQSAVSNTTGTDNEFADGGMHRHSGRQIAKGVLSGTGVVLLWNWFNGQEFDIASDSFADQLPLLMIPAAAIVVAIPLCRTLHFSHRCASSAFLALFVHLLGAGGLQITFPMMVLLLLYATATSLPTSPVPKGEPRHRIAGIAARTCQVLLLMVCLFGCLQFALIPFKKAELQKNLAMSKAASGDSNGAKKAWKNAIEADPWLPELRQRLVQQLAYEQQQTVRRHARTEAVVGQSAAILEESFLEVRRACDELILSDIHSGFGYHQRSHALRLMSDVVADADLKKQCLHDLEHVVSLDPTNSALWTELAQFQKADGLTEAAAVSASRALKIEASNQNWGHSDQYLSAEQRNSLQKIAVE